MLKTALICSLLSLFVAICLAEEEPHQVSSTDRKPTRRRVLVTDCIVKLSQSPVSGPEITRTVTNALDITIASSGGKKFDLITSQEVEEAAKRLRLPYPEKQAPSGHWTQEEKFRLGTALHADLLCSSETAVRVNAKKYDFAIIPTIYDLNTRIPLSGGHAFVEGKLLDVAIKQGVEEVVHQCVQNLRPFGRVLSRMDTKVTLAPGTHDGIRAGDDGFVLREVAGTPVTIGRIKVTRCTATFSEGEMLKETDDIQAGDSVLLTYAIPVTNTSK